MHPAQAHAGFAARHPWDRTFFLAWIAACWLGVIMGFAPAVMLRFSGQADYEASIVLQIHAIVFPAWLVLLTLQILFIRLRWHSLHRLFGLSALVFIPVMVVTGVWSEILAQRFRGPGDLGTQSFFIIPLAYMAMFTVLAGAALASRRDPPAHKRLMLLANTTIVGAAFARWWGGWIMDVAGDGYGGMLLNTYAGFYVITAAAMAYDVATRGRLHPVYVVAVPAILVAQIAVSIIYHSEEWRPIARWIAGI